MNCYAGEHGIMMYCICCLGGWKTGCFGRLQECSKDDRVADIWFW